MKSLSALILFLLLSIFIVSPLFSETTQDDAKELFPNIPNPFYEENSDISYDEKPITFFGINARWLSDKLPNHDLKHIFSLDFGYALTGFQNNGWGIGYNYEQKIWRYFSLKAQTSFLTAKFMKSNIFCMGLRTDLYMYVYPFGKGLEWLYAGVGGGADFLFYSGENVPETPRDISFSVLPVIGWKQQLFKRNIMIDFTVGYRFIVNGTENYEDNSSLVHDGFEAGIKFKIFWKKMLKNWVDSYIIDQESNYFARKIFIKMKNQEILTPEEAEFLKNSI